MKYQPQPEVGGPVFEFEKLHVIQFERYQGHDYVIMNEKGQAFAVPQTPLQAMECLGRLMGVEVAIHNDAARAVFELYRHEKGTRP